MFQRLVALVFALTLSSSAFAAAPAPAAGGGGDDKLAVMFQFGGLSSMSLDPFSGINGLGAGLGAKYFVIPSLAIRASLNINTDSVSRPANTPVGQVGADGGDSYTAFGLNVGAEYHLNRSKVSP